MPHRTMTPTLPDIRKRLEALGENPVVTANSYKKDVSHLLSLLDRCGIYLTAFKITCGDKDLASELETFLTEIKGEK